MGKISQQLCMSLDFTLYFVNVDFMFFQSLCFLFCIDARCKGQSLSLSSFLFLLKYSTETDQGFCKVNVSEFKWSLW